MAPKSGTLPPGEPSHENVMAALIRARHIALERIAAVERGEPLTGMLAHHVTPDDEAAHPTPTPEAPENA